MKRTSPMTRNLVIGASLLALSIGYCTINNKEEEHSSPSSQPSSLEKITFESVKQIIDKKSPDEQGVVQSYLDQLFRDRAKHGSGIDGWKSFAAFVYDPHFEKMFAEYSRNGFTPENSNDAYLGHKKASLLMSTPCMKPGEKGTVYVSRKLFEFAYNQDEILSSFDNESYHAGLCHTEMIHLALPSYPKDPELMNIVDEMFSFDLQFRGIELGKRKVSQKFVEWSLPGARILFRELERVADESSIRSPDAKKAYNFMLQQKTLPYFVDQRDIPNKKPYRLDH